MEPCGGPYLPTLIIIYSDKTPEHTMRATCKSCQTNRRPLRGLGLCNKCHYWQSRLETDTKKLEIVRSNPLEYHRLNPTLLHLRVREAERVLEEFRWREETLLADDVSVGRLKSIVRLLARDARSAVSYDTLLKLEDLDKKGRKALYAVLLPIVENLPCKLPSLHCDETTERGLDYGGGWDDYDRKYRTTAAWHSELGESSRIHQRYIELRQSASQRLRNSIGVSVQILTYGAGE